jgi:[acyl-carrier-protein] S-malonyltransferase
MRSQLTLIPLQTPDIPVLHNVDVKTYRDADAIRDILAQQLFSPVRWVDTIRKLAADGVTHIVECGPGNILTGLDKRIDRDLQHLSLSKSETIREAISVLC